MWPANAYEISTFFLQYTFNIFIYAARSKNIRVAYKMYLKKKAPFLFRRKVSMDKNSVFVINPRVVVTDPTPCNFSHRFITECDKFESLDQKCEQMIQSYIEKSKVGAMQKFKTQLANSFLCS